MLTTIGIFHKSFLNPSAGYVAGRIAVGVSANVVPAVLPHLVPTQAGVAALTQGGTPHKSLLSGILAVGWQDVNYLFSDGAWYELNDILGSVGNRLAPPRQQPDKEPTSTGATHKQEEVFLRITTSHVFDRDRDALRLAFGNASLEQASELIDYVIADVKVRKQKEKEEQELNA